MHFSNMFISKGDGVTVSGIFTVMLTMGESEIERPGIHARAQMSSLLKQGYPHYHVSAPDATTQSLKTREERRKGGCQSNMQGNTFA